MKKIFLVLWHQLVRRTQGIHRNIASRLFKKAQPGTLSHDLPSSRCPRRQRALSGVTTVAVDPPPPLTKSTEPKQNNCFGRVCGLQQLRLHVSVEPVPCHTNYHFVSAFVKISIRTTTGLLMSSDAWRSQLLCTPCPCYAATQYIRCFAVSSIHFLPFVSAVYRNTVSVPNTK